jgi:hypothetical protein
VRGLFIGNFAKSGILIDGGSTNAVQDNVIGADSSGTPLPNSEGVLFDNSIQNMIGGADPGQGNFIVNSEQDGILIPDAGSTGNDIVNNSIGLGVDSGLAPNGTGVKVTNAKNNTIGPGNVISGNTGPGVDLESADENSVLGNRIGITFEGASAGNDVGVAITESSNNQIGGGDPIAGNDIGGNSIAGIAVVGESAVTNTIEDNNIGLTSDGALVPNAIGVALLGGQLNMVGAAGHGNVIAGNADNGIFITGPAQNNAVSDNFIGMTEDGTAAANGGDGVSIENSKGNLIGSSDSVAGNIIGGNALSGIQITGADSVGNSIGNNLIGMNSSGQAVANVKDGIVINGSPGTTIGGGLDPLGTGSNPNHIGGNGRYGLYLFSPNTHGTDVTGNDFGILNDVVVPNGGDNILIENSWENQIGSANSGNVIVGSKDNGIDITGENAYANDVEGNLIGTNGVVAIPNDTNGVFINNAGGNLIGSGEETGDWNEIAGNLFNGVAIAGPGAVYNVVGDNQIGVILKDEKWVAMGNHESGVAVVGASENFIGPYSDKALGNVISGNGQQGVAIGGGSEPSDSNQVFGNFIGTSPDGQTAMPNAQDGVALFDGARYSVIGGPVASDLHGCDPCNVISGNGQNGVEVLSGADTNKIEGNMIGLRAALECHDPTQPSTSFSGCALGNGGNGIRITDATDTTIGGYSEPGECSLNCNLIAFNHTGVAIVGTAHSTSVAADSIFLNNGLNIDLGDDGVTPNDKTGDIWDGDSGPNDLLNFAEIGSAVQEGGELLTSFSLETSAQSEFVVDLYASDACDSASPSAQLYLGSAELKTDVHGEATMTRVATLPDGAEWTFVTTTVSDASNNVSEVSACRAITTSATELANSASAGATEIQVHDGSGFGPGDEVRIGTAGSEETDTIDRVDAGVNALAETATGATLTLDAPLSHSHAANEPVVNIGGGLGTDVIWGDFDCNGTWNALDALTFLRQTAGIETDTAPCPTVGDSAVAGGQPLTWGDTDGDHAAQTDDVIAMLRALGGELTVTPRWLPRLGKPVRALFQ